jgi:hypothetical protein
MASNSEKGRAKSSDLRIWYSQTKRCLNEALHTEKFQVSRAARNFRAKRERLRIPSAAEGGLTMESAKLQAAKRP